MKKTKRDKAGLSFSGKCKSTRKIKYRGIVVSEESFFNNYSDWGVHYLIVSGNYKHLNKEYTSRRTRYFPTPLEALSWIDFMWNNPSAQTFSWTIMTKAPAHRAKKK